MSDRNLPDSDAQTFARDPGGDTVTLGGPVSAVPALQQMGDYTLESEIARGGMGIVYKARQVSLNRTVAFKMVLSGQFASTEDLDRFHVEAEAAASLDHPNIVPIYEVGEHAGHHFFSMKLVDGSSMAREMRRLVAEPREGVRILAKVCRAIHYAHQRGILHRDLKPGNILLDKAGEPHVTDFGLAKKFEGDSNLTQTGTILGTPAYMAPEQASRTRGALTTAADVYSLGAILYEILTGRPPFVSDSPIDTLMMLLERDPERPGALVPGCDRDLETIALKCLEKSPTARFASADALAQDLEHWLANEPISARPITTWERGVKWTRRRPAIAALIAAVVVVAVAGFAGVIFQWRQAVAARLDAANKAEVAVRARDEAQRAAAAEAVARKGEMAQRQAADAARLQAEQQKTIAVEQKSVAERALASAETNLYFNNIDLADREWLANDVAHTDQLIGTAPARLRNWEWHYLSRLAHMEGLAIPAHDAGILALATSADGSRIISGASDGTIKTWSAANGKDTSAVKLTGDRAGGIAALMFSPDLTVVASMSAPQNSAVVLDLPVTLWDTATGRVLAALPRGFYSTVSFDPTSATMVTASVPTPELDAKVPASGPLPLSAGGGVGLLRTWSTRSGTEVSTARSVGGVGLPLDIAISSDGARIAMSGFGAVKIQEGSTGREIVTLARSDFATRVVFSPDGSRIAAASPRSDGVRVWNVATGDLMWSAVPPPGAVRIAFSGDGRYLAAACADRTVRIFESTTGRETRRLTGHTATIEAMAFTPAGNRLLTGGQDKAVRIWELADAPSAVAAEIESPAPRLGGLKVSADKRVLAAVTDARVVKAWDITTGRLRYERAGPTLSMPLASAASAPLSSNADGRRAITAIPFVLSRDGRVMVHQEARTFDGAGRPIVLRSPAAVGEVVADPMAFMKTDREIVNAIAMAVALSEHGDRAALVTMNMTQPAPGRAPTSSAGQLDVWDTRTRTSVAMLTRPGHPISHLRLTRDGERAAFAVGSPPGSPGTRAVEICDLPVRRPCLALPDASGPLSFSRDDRLIALTTTARAIEIRDARTGIRRAVLPAQTAVISGIAFSPDATRLATVSSTGIVKVFDVASGHQLLTLRETSGPFEVREMTINAETPMLPGFDVAFSDDGHQIVVTAFSSNAKVAKVQIKTWNGAPR
jgi:WD40 repeat protein